MTKEARKTDLTRQSFTELLRIIAGASELDPAHMAEVETIARRNGYYFDGAGALIEGSESGPES